MADRLHRQFEASNMLSSNAMQSIKGISLQCRFNQAGSVVGQNIYSSAKSFNWTGNRIKLNVRSF
jgi:hypothetical protein